MNPQFLTILERRQQEHWPWLAQQVPGLEKYCHPLFSTYSPFCGVSGTVHVDSSDTEVSILVNLGQHAILELPAYGRKVELQPLYVVFLQTKSHPHRTTPHPAYRKLDIDKLERWAVTCFFHQAIEKSVHFVRAIDAASC